MTNSNKELTERFWNPSEIPEPVKDWISNNVIEAIDFAFHELDVYIYEKNKQLFVVASSIEKPLDEFGNRDLWIKKFNLDDVINDWISDYEDELETLIRQADYFEEVAHRLRDKANIEDKK